MLHERLRQFRCESVEKARQAGIPAYFLDETEGVLRVLPNGRKERIVVTEGRPTVHTLGHMPSAQLIPVGPQACQGGLC